MTDAASGEGFFPIELRLRDGRRVTIRTARPEDGEALQDAFKRLSVESRYTRFMSPLRELPPGMLDRATHPETDRELQLLALSREGEREQIVAGARYSAAAGSRDCEFALAVVDDWQRLGLARRLLGELIRAARARGFERMDGYILASNAGMLRLAGELGFVRVESPEGPGVRMVRRDLSRGG